MSTVFISRIPNLVQVDSPSSPGFAGMIAFAPAFGVTPAGWGLCSTTTTTTFSGTTYAQLYARVPAGWKSAGDTLVPILNSPDTDLVPYIKLYDDSSTIVMAGSPFIGSNFSETFDTKTGSFTAEISKSYVINSGSPVAVTLPAAGLNGDVIYFKNIGAGLVTLTAAGSDKIDSASATTTTVSQYQAIKIKQFAANLWGVY
jgi:hypothetical protein